MQPLPFSYCLGFALLLTSCLPLGSLVEAGADAGASLTRLGARVVQGRWTEGNLSSARVESNEFLVGDLTGVLRQTPATDIKEVLRPLDCSETACRQVCAGHVTVVLLSSSSLEQLRLSCPLSSAWSTQRILHGNESLAETLKLTSIANCLLPWQVYGAADGAQRTDCQITAFVVLTDSSKFSSKPRLLLLGSESAAKKLHFTAGLCPDAAINSLASSSMSSGPFATFRSEDVLKYLSDISKSWSGPEACEPGSRGVDATGDQEVGASNPDGGASKSLPSSVIFGILLSVCLFLLVFCFFATRICPSKDSSLTIRARAILRHRAYSLDRRTADIHLTQPVPDPERPSDLHLEVPLDDSCRFLRVEHGSPGLSPDDAGSGGGLRFGSLTKSLSSIGSSLLRCGSRGEFRAAATSAGPGDAATCSKQAD